MPTNKNAQLRYKVLDRCFGDRNRLYSLEDLVDCVNEKMTEMGYGCVSDRTIKADIKFMRDSEGYNAPIATQKTCDSYRGMIWCYRYTIPDFSIFNSELSEKDVADLQRVIDILERYKGVTAYQWVEEIISDLKYRFGLSSNIENFIGFDQNTDLKGLEYLSTLIDATIAHRVLKVKYKSYKEDAVEITFTAHPYFVKQFNNRWFLFALDSETSYLTNIALDRIICITYADDVKFIPNKIDFTHFFDDVIGVTIPKDGEKILLTLQFAPNQYPYVLSKPLHHSQKVVDDEQRIVSIEVMPNYELDQCVLSFGSRVVVLSPESYKKHIKDVILENLKNYF